MQRFREHALRARFENSIFGIILITGALCVALCMGSNAFAYDSGIVKTNVVPSTVTAPAPISGQQMYYQGLPVQWSTTSGYVNASGNPVYVPDPSLITYSPGTTPGRSALMNQISAPATTPLSSESLSTKINAQATTPVTPASSGDEDFASTFGGGFFDSAATGSASVQKNAVDTTSGWTPAVAAATVPHDAFIAGVSATPPKLVATEVPTLEKVNIVSGGGFTDPTDGNFKSGVVVTKDGDPQQYWMDSTSLKNLQTDLPYVKVSDPNGILPKPVAATEAGVSAGGGQGVLAGATVNGATFNFGVAGTGKGGAATPAVRSAVPGQGLVAEKDGNGNPTGSYVSAPAVPPTTGDTAQFSDGRVGHWVSQGSTPGTGYWAASDGSKMDSQSPVTGTVADSSGNLVSGATSVAAPPPPPPTSVVMSRDATGYKSDGNTSQYYDPKTGKELPSTSVDPESGLPQANDMTGVPSQIVPNYDASQIHLSEGFKLPNGTTVMKDQNGNLWQDSSTGTPIAYEDANGQQFRVANTGGTTSPGRAGMLNSTDNSNLGGPTYDPSTGKFSTPVGVNNPGSLTKSDIANTKYDAANENYDPDKIAGKGEYAYSQKLKLLDPGRTKDQVDAIGMVSQVSMAAGAVSTGIQGQVSNYGAAKDGSQVADLQAAASQSRFAGIKDLALGTGNVMAGAYQMVLGMNHKKESSRVGAATQNLQANVDKNTGVLDTSGGLSGHAGDSGGGQQGFGSSGYVGSNDDLTNKVISTFQVNSRGTNALNIDASRCADPTCRQEALQKRNGEFQQKATEVASQVGNIGGSAIQEQDQGKSIANMGALKSMITGLPQMMTGFFSMKAASEYDSAAKNLQAAQNAALPAPSFDPLPTTAGADTNNPFGQPQIAADSGANENLNTNSGIPLQDAGFNPADPGSSGVAPVPGGFQVSPDQNAGKGLGGSTGVGAAGGATNPVPVEKEVGSQLAMEQGGRTYLESGGNKNNGGRAPASTDGSGMGGLADLFNKMFPADDASRNHQGIDQATRFRTLASDNGSLLGKDVNIFGRIHDRYQDKRKSGAVGI